MKKPTWGPSGLCTALLLVSTWVSADDWRKTASDAEKLANLVELVPGTAIWMQQIGYRYADLYHAAKQGKWDFAIYQAEEIEKLAEVVELARPKRAATMREFRAAVFPALHDTVAQRDWSTFEPAFRQLAGECMSCHVKNDHGFIVLPTPPKTPHSPVLED